MSSGRQLVDALGRPAWAIDPELASIGDAGTGTITSTNTWVPGASRRSADDIVDLLWPAGVPVAQVMQPHQQGELEQLLARQFFETLDHPVMGSARYSTLPMRFSNGPSHLHQTAAPLLGEHTVELLREIGVSDDEIAELERDGVIGRAPAGTKS